jgi:hypothetical protein
MVVNSLSTWLFFIASRNSGSRASGRSSPAVWACWASSSGNEIPLSQSAAGVEK